MRYAIISDIHSNLEALEAVLADIKNQKIDNIFCAGDIVGYGANPKECLHIIMKNNISSVAGNHDWAVCGRLDASYFIPEGKEAVNWNRNHIQIEDVTYLNSLPLTVESNDFVIVHGTLDDPNYFKYLDNISYAEDTFNLMQRNICFVGHTHVPHIFIRKYSNIYFSDVLDVEIDPDSKYIVNVGSVGQPRDGVPLASYCIYDAELAMIQIKRVQYDISKAQSKILEAGLPELLAKRLSVGL